MSNESISSQQAIHTPINQSVSDKTTDEAPPVSAAPKAQDVNLPLANHNVSESPIENKEEKIEKEVRTAEQPHPVAHKEEKVEVKEVVPPVVEHKKEEVVPPVVEHKKEEVVPPVVEHKKEEVAPPVVEHKKEEVVPPVVEHKKEEVMPPVVEKEEKKEELVQPVVEKEQKKEEVVQPVVDKVEKKEEITGVVQSDVGKEEKKVQVVTTPVKKRKTEATPEEKFYIYGALSGLGVLAFILAFTTKGFWSPVNGLLPIFILAYRIFYHFFPHDWEKEKYYMSHVHLGLALLLGIVFMPVFQLNTEVLCQDSPYARLINMNSIAYFLIDTLVLIDTIWITHHSLSLGTALFGCAGTSQVIGGSVYVWYAEVGGLLYHISRVWPKDKRVREIFLVCYFFSRMCMLWIASISWRCTMSLHASFFTSDFVGNLGPGLFFLFLE